MTFQPGIDLNAQLGMAAKAASMTGLVMLGINLGAKLGFLPAPLAAAKTPGDAVREMTLDFVQKVIQEQAAAMQNEASANQNQANATVVDF